MLAVSGNGLLLLDSNSGGSVDSKVGLHKKNINVLATGKDMILTGR